MISPTIDVEPTNRCNAWCSFCPRDQTPHQGLMSLEVFEQCLVRINELNERKLAIETKPIEQISLCGLGEPLINKHLPEMIRSIRAAGYSAHLSSNGALLSDARSAAILDAGLNSAGLNVGEIGEAYEAVYQLPWERTLERVLSFKELSRGRARVYVVLVNHGGSPERTAELKEFWKERGIGTRTYDELMNRGGALDLDHMQFHQYPERQEAEDILNALDERPLCGIPLFGTFIGYDGQFYLCCSDWKKEAPLGSVFDASLADLVTERVRFVTSRKTVCDTCNYDPANQLTVALREIKAGTRSEQSRSELIGKMRMQWGIAVEASDHLVPEVIHEAIEDARRDLTPSEPRKFIPVAAT